MASYKEVREDFEYLESIAELEDQVELDSQRIYLMQNPTKNQAASMYESAIYLWFNEHAGQHDDPRIEEIADRYGCDIVSVSYDF